MLKQQHDAGSYVHNQGKAVAQGSKPQCYWAHIISLDDCYEVINFLE